MSKRPICSGQAPLYVVGRHQKPHTWSGVKSQVDLEPLTSACIAAKDRREKGRCHLEVKWFVLERNLLYHKVLCLLNVDLQSKDSCGSRLEDNTVSAYEQRTSFPSKWSIDRSSI